MKSFLAIALIAVSFSTWAQDKATPEAQSTAVLAAPAAPVAPTLLFSYNYYHYEMTGQREANTEIYKFGRSTVDLNLITATWLYSPTWTFVALVPHISNKVETVYTPTLGGFSLTDTTRGLGDVRFMAITPVALDPLYLTMVDVGVTAPTGSINESFTSNPSQRAAYNMQLGSGTFDLYVGATLSNTVGRLNSTARAQITLRDGHNGNGYRLGNEGLAKLTSFYTLTNYFSAGVTGNYRARDAIQGHDDKYEIFNNFNRGGISGDGHQYYHGAQVNWDANAVAKLQSPSYKSFNAALEFGIPFAQESMNKDDVELNINYYAAASLNASF